MTTTETLSAQKPRAAKPSAVDSLRKMMRSAAPQEPCVPEAVASDPVLAGARLVKNVVQLGPDPELESVARAAYTAGAVARRAAARLAKQTDRIRAYGVEKRAAYNDAFRAEVATVAVPFRLDPSAPPSSPEGEVRYVQVTSSNRYSVNQEVALANKEALGDAYGKLFVEETSKRLRPNTEGVLRGILEQAGLKPDELEEAMGLLFEETIVVRASEVMERESKALPEALHPVVAQIATRAQASVKIPG
jgi:hypothetical protein